MKSLIFTLKWLALEKEKGKSAGKLLVEVFLDDEALQSVTISSLPLILLFYHHVWKVIDQISQHSPQKSSRFRDFPLAQSDPKIEQSQTQTQTQTHATQMSGLPAYLMSYTQVGAKTKTEMLCDLRKRSC